MTPAFPHRVRNLILGFAMQAHIEEIEFAKAGRGGGA